MDEDSETQKLLNGSVESPLNALPRAKATKLQQKPNSRWMPSCWFIDCLPCIRARYVLAFMLFLGLCNVYALRVNLSVAIVQMTAEHPHHHQRSFDWSSSEQGWVLSSFFFGYLITQIPGGWLATRFGGKYVFGIGVLVTSLLTLITPQMAYLNLWALVACRVVIGFFEGVTFPSMIAMFGVWSPPLERSMLTSIALSGPYIGNVIAFPLSGVLCETMGWPWVFYCFGFAGIAWFIAWLFLVSNTPAEHPRISPKEIEYIESTIQAEILTRKATPKRPPPWKYILTSPAVIAIAIANFCSNWGFYTLLTCLPTFLKQTLCLDIKKNGFYSAIPYLCEFIVALGWGQVTDILRQRRLVSTTVIRKVNNTLGLCLPALFLLLCSYYGTNTLWAVVFLSLSVGSIGFTVSGFPVNNLDVAPKYAGVILGFANMIGTIPGFLGPIVAKQIAKEPAVGACGSECNDPLTVDTYQQEWRLVFIIAAEVYVFGAMAYNLLGSGKKQPWAEGYIDTDQLDDNTKSFEET